MREPDQAPEGARERSCDTCGAPLSPDQDWCLSCGTGRARTLARGVPGRRTAAAVGGSLALLLAGTAVAAVAALNHHPAAPTAALAQVTAPATGDTATGETPPAQAPPEAPAVQAPPTAEAPAEASTPEHIGTLATPQIKLPKVPPAKQMPPPKIPLESPTPPPAPPEASEGPAAGEEGLGAEPGAGGREHAAPGGVSGEGTQGGGPSESTRGGGETGGEGEGRGGEEGETGGEGEEGGGEERADEEGGGSKGEGEGAPGKPRREGSEPLILDTEAAGTFNPYRYPESSIGNPQLAIDGTHATAWRAMIEPAEYPAGEVQADATPPAPEGEGVPDTQTPPEEPTGTATTPTATTPTATSPAEAPGRVPTGPAGIGVTLELEQPESLSGLLLSSSTPGMTFAVYAAAARHAPAGAPDSPASGWTRLAGPRALHGKDARVTLGPSARRWRWVLLWIVSAPETPSAGRSAGEVAVNEVELQE